MSRYASATAVPVERSRAEIESILTRYGATHFGYVTAPGQAAIAFQAKGRRIRFELPLPPQTDLQFTRTPAKRMLRTKEEAFKAWEQACRQRWRALALAIKAKLEAVEAGISTFEDEFLAHIVLPSGSTLGRWAAPQLATAYGRGEMPPLLLEAPP